MTYYDITKLDEIMNKTYEFKQIKPCTVVEVRKRKNDFLIAKIINPIEIGFDKCYDTDLNAIYEIYIKYVNKEGKIAKKGFDLDKHTITVRYSK